MEILARVYVCSDVVSFPLTPVSPAIPFLVAVILRDPKGRTQVTRELVPEALKILFSEDNGLMSHGLQVKLFRRSSSYSGNTGS